MDEWKTIEEAPRDGTFVLCVEPSGHINILQWATPTRDPDGGYWRSRVNEGPGWRPTHFIPLPSPPSIEAPEPRI
jgi:hypothetical protein